MSVLSTSEDSEAGPVNPRRKGANKKLTNLPKGPTSAAQKQKVINLDQPGFQRIDGVLTIIPVSRAAWYEGIAEGRYPSGVQIGKRSVAWSNESLKQLISDLTS